MILMGENENTWRKTFSSSTMSTKTIMWTHQGLNLDMHGERLLTNCCAAYNIGMLEGG
jgi:hypothetical protein